MDRLVEVMSTEFLIHKNVDLGLFGRALAAAFPGSHFHVRMDKRRHPDNRVLELLTPIRHTADDITQFLRRFSEEQGYQVTQHPRDPR